MRTVKRCEACFIQTILWMSFYVTQSSLAAQKSKKFYKQQSGKGSLWRKAGCTSINSWTRREKEKPAYLSAAGKIA